MSKQWQLVFKNNLRLMRLALPKWQFCIVGIAANGLVTYILSVALGLLSGNVIETVKRGISPSGEILKIVLLVAISSTISGLGYALNSYYGFKIRIAIQHRIVAVLINQTEADVRKRHSGNDMTTLTSDMATVEDYFFQGFLFTFMRPFVGGIAAAITLFVIDWRLFVVSMIFGGVPVVLRALQTSHLHRLSSKSKDANVTVTTLCKEIVSGNVTHRMLGTTNDAISSFHQANDDSAKQKYSELRFENLMKYASELTSVVSLLFLLIIGINGLASGAISITGILVALNLQGTVSQMFFGFSDTWEYMVRSSVTAERVLTTLNYPVENQRIEKSNDTVETATNPRIALDNISFAYVGGNSLLNNMSLSLEKGTSSQYTVLEGESGCGKSTILQLFLQFYAPTSGSVTLNGVESTECSLQSWRKQFSYLSQDCTLFHRTVAENIAIGVFGREAERSEIVRAAELAGADNFISKLADGYDTMVAEKGSNFSRGEIQRILLARAVISDAPVLLLDEPTSSLDAESERIVYQAIDELAKQKIVLMVSHKPVHSNAHEITTVRLHHCGV